MHKLFYFIGVVTLLPAIYFLHRSIDGGGIASVELAIYVFLGACLWLAIGRGLELLERIANAVAPLPEVEPDSTPADTVEQEQRAINRGL